MLAAFNRHWQEEHTYDEARPKAAWVVAPEMSVAKAAAYDDGDCRDKCGQQTQGGRNEELIDAIEEFYH